MTDHHPFHVRFWGVRGTIATTGADTLRYGGNTTCLEMRCGPHLLIFDAGTGIRLLGGALEATGDPVTADLFFTHTHIDHVVGFPFFAPFHDKRSRISLWEGHLGPDLTLGGVLGCLMTAPLFPVPLRGLERCMDYRKFTAGQVLEPRPGLIVRTCPLNHPNGGTGYRVDYAGRSICLITDTEHPAQGRDETIADLVRGADVMIYDATFSDAEYAEYAGWGHSTWEEALRLADHAGVRHPVIFHHAPERTDDMLDIIAAAARARHPGALVAREGQMITPDGEVRAQPGQKTV